MQHIYFFYSKANCILCKRNYCYLLSGQSFYHALAPAGTYNGEFQLNAKPDPDCDPSQGPCEEWLPGDYTVKIGEYSFIIANSNTLTCARKLWRIS